MKDSDCILRLSPFFNPGIITVQCEITINDFNLDPTIVLITAK
jgi:hypothetical protein